VSEALVSTDPTPNKLPAATSTKPSLLARIIDAAIEITAIVVWAYIIVQVFVFDLDRIVRSYLPSSCAWVVDFKFVFVLIIAAGLGCLIRRIWKPLTYVIFYPVIVLFWKIPFLALKQRSWALAIAFINAVASFFGSIRYNLIIPAVLFAAGSIILFGNSTALISLSTAALLALLLLAYGRRLISIFKTPRVFQIYQKVASWVPKIRTSSCSLDEDIRGLPYEQLSAEQAQKWRQNLVTSLLLSRVCLFAARKLRSYSKSGYAKISSVFICAFLIALTVVIFGLINLGLYKIEPTSYRSTGRPNSLTFFHYSLNRMIFNPISELEPVGALPKLAYDAEALFALFLVAIFVSLLLSARPERQTQDLNETIEKLEAESAAVDLAITVEYRFDTVDTAVAALEKIQSGTTSLIQTLSGNL